jgi:Na+/H+-dicarboxylate symporter
VLNGVDLNIAHYILLIVLSTVGSAGAAPVPSAGLVLIITAYNTVFGGTGVPKGFEFIVAIDWLVDRIITALNVTGDTVCCRIIAVTTNMGEMEELEKMTASVSSDKDKDIPSAGPVVMETEPDSDQG